MDLKQNDRNLSEELKVLLHLKSNVQTLMREQSEGDLKTEIRSQSSC